MRFDSYETAFAILRFGDGRPFKVDAAEAVFLPDRVYEYNDTLFGLLSKAFEQGDRLTLDSLWSAAHRYYAKSDADTEVSDSASPPDEPAGETFSPPSTPK